MGEDKLPLKKFPKPLRIFLRYFYCIDSSVGVKIPDNIPFGHSTRASQTDGKAN